MPRRPVQRLRPRHRGLWVAALVVLVASCAVGTSHEGAGRGPGSASTSPTHPHRSSPVHPHRSSPAHAHHARRTPDRPPSGAPSATRRQLLDALAHTRVLASRPFPGGYDRDCGPGHRCVFGPAWTDDTSAPDGHNGCDTRNDVLREQLSHPVVEPGTHGCKVIGGTFHDPYTGRTFDFAVHHQTIQIDHLVPLAYAWDMGASRWTQARRERFANDTSVELLASWGPANESKGDSGPGDWLPINRAFRCTYLQRYLTAIDNYRLAITSADAASIRYTARGC